MSYAKMLAEVYVRNVETMGDKTLNTEKGVDGLTLEVLTYNTQTYFREEGNKVYIADVLLLRMLQRLEDTN